MAHILPLIEKASKPARNITAGGFSVLEFKTAKPILDSPSFFRFHRTQIGYHICQHQCSALSRSPGKQFVVKAGLYQPQQTHNNSGATTTIYLVCACKHSVARRHSIRDPVVVVSEVHKWNQRIPKRPGRDQARRKKTLLFLDTVFLKKRP